MSEINDTPTTPVQTGLTIQDLTLVLQVIQVSSSRGAFKADEMAAVGSLYDRIFGFLEASGAITKNLETAAPPAEPAAEVKATSKNKKAK